MTIGLCDKLKTTFIVSTAFSAFIAFIVFMKQFIAGPLPDHARNILRRFGYGEQRTRSGQISYVRRLSGERFPRYHAYVEDTNGGIQVNIHVDQKEASYDEGHAHAGEYDGPLVEREMAMIVQFVASLKAESASQTAPSATTQTKKPGFLSKFF